MDLRKGWMRHLYIIENIWQPTLAGSQLCLDFQLLHKRSRRIKTMVGEQSACLCSSCSCLTQGSASKSAKCPSTSDHLHPSTTPVLWYAGKVSQSHRKTMAMPPGLGGDLKGRQRCLKSFTQAHAPWTTTTRHASMNRPELPEATKCEPKGQGA